MANKNLIDEIAIAMNQLPRFLVSSYLKTGKIRLVSRSEMNMRYKDALGLLDIPSRQIYMRNDLETRQVKDIIFHEMGHYVDYQIEALCGCLVSDSEEFQKLFHYAERKYFYEIEYYFLSNSKEFFAYIASRYFADLPLEPCFKKYFEKSLEVIRREEENKK